MRARTVLAVLVVVGSCLLPAPAQAAVLDEAVWIARYDGPGHFVDVANDSALSPDGTAIAVTGLSDPTGYLLSADFATVLYDSATGQERWVSRYNGTGDGWDNARAVVFSPDGTRVFVTGNSHGDGNKGDFATIAYDAATGAELWVARYDGPSHLGDTSVSLAVTPDGSRLFVSGVSAKGHIAGNGYGRVFMSVAYDAATGDQLWVRRLNPSRFINYLRTSVLTPDGGTLLVTGWGRRNGVGGSSAGTAAYDSMSGEVLWAVRTQGFAAAYAAAVSPDGNTLFATGQSKGGYGTVAYDIATGDVRWRSVMEAGAGYGSAWALALSPDGSALYVTGSAAWRHGSCYRDDYTTAAYDTATGDELWVSTYNGPGKGEDWAQAVATSPDGTQVYVTGESAGFGGAYSCVHGSKPRTGQDFATIGYDASSGANLWVTRYDSPGKAGYDSAHDMVVDASGNIYVTGEGHSDFVTLRYGAGLSSHG